jgi:hypothetical protein
LGIARRIVSLADVRPAPDQFRSNRVAAATARAERSGAV